MPARVALVVGIGHYEYHHSLELCPPSAEEAFRLLISPEYGKCDPNRSKLKTVKEGESLTAPDLYREIRNVIHSLQVGDQFVFFFSGHAELRHDRLFLTTTNSEKPQQGYRFSDLIDNLHDNDIDKAILVIDACHSGAMFDSIKNLQSSEWRPYDLPKGFGFMAAGSRYETASQVQELGHTLFSYYFCEGIKNGIKTEGQYITLPGLRKYINSQTKQNFRGYRQRVHTWVREGDAELWLSLNKTPAITTGPVHTQGESSPSLLNPKWIIAFIFFLVLALGVTTFIVYSRFYQPYINIQATNQAIMATIDTLALTSTAAAFQVESNPLDQDAIRTATASARELATARAVPTAAIAANFTSTPTPTKPVPTDTPTPTATLPGITNIRTADSAEMVFIPAGDFLMGSSAEDDLADNDEKPQHSVSVDAYWIDRYEVTNSQYKKFIDATGHRVPFIDAGWATRYSWVNGTYPEGLGSHPVVLVNWNDARAYCSWSGGRLPTEPEWEKAAKGNDGRIYPWGNEVATCDYAIINDGILGCGTNGIWPVGSKPKGVSQYGAVDLAGNVWEWTSSIYNKYPYEQNDIWEATESNKERTIRGGSWDDVANRARSAYRLDVPPESQNISLGFRCVVPEKPPTATPAPTPSPTPAPIIRKKDGAEMVYVLEGKFVMGDDQSRFLDQKPEHEVEPPLDAFWIDKYEITREKYQVCVDNNVCSKSCVETDSCGDSEAGLFNKGEYNLDTQPIVGIYWTDALAYCRWVDARLPTEAEWEKAARGTDGRKYPWGDEFDANKLNSTYDVGKDRFVNIVAPVGSFPEGASPYGALDMAGNAWEWTSSLYKLNKDEDEYFGYPYDSEDGREKLDLGDNSHSTWAVRGGSWENGDENLTTTWRNSYTRGTRYAHTGFRCARSVE